MFRHTALFLAAAVSLSALSPALAEDSKPICDNCHGADGNAPVNVFPKLAGQYPDYLELQAHRYLAHMRVDDIMTPSLETVDPSAKEIHEMSLAYAQDTRSRAEFDAKLAAKGRAVYTAESTSAVELACEDCHGDYGEGHPHTKIRAIPSLADQNPEYLMRALERYRRMNLKGQPARVRAMARVARALKQEDLRAVANYAASLNGTGWNLASRHE